MHTVFNNVNDLFMWKYGQFIKISVIFEHNFFLLGEDKFVNKYNSNVNRIDLNVNQFAYFQLLYFLEFFSLSITKNLENDTIYFLCIEQISKYLEC